MAIVATTENGGGVIEATPSIKRISVEAPYTGAILTQESLHGRLYVAVRVKISGVLTWLGNVNGILSPDGCSVFVRDAQDNIVADF